MRNVLIPGKVTKRKDKRWECQIPLPEDSTGKKKTKHIYGKTKTECLKKAHEFCNSYIEDSPTNAEEILFQDFAISFLEENKPFYSIQTNRAYESALRVHIFPDLGSKKLKYINDIDCQRLVNKWVKEGFSKNSINVWHGVLGVVLEKAVKMRYINRNPAKYLTIPKTSETTKRLEDFDPKILLENAKHSTPDFVSIFEFDLLTGLRASELVALTWDRVNFEDQSILIDRQLPRKKTDLQFIPTKNRKERRVPLPKKAIDILRETRVIQNENRMKLGKDYIGNPHGLVFTDLYGRRLIPHTLYQNFKKNAEECGCENITFHDLRHWYAVLSIQGGVDFKTISDSMGHSTVAFTMQKYAFVNSDMRKNAAERINAAFNSL